MSSGSPIIVIDSTTRLGPDARDAVVLAGSHCGVYAAYTSAKWRVRAVVLNDAGIGRERAGIAGLDYLQSLGVPAAAISHLSARIGDGRDAQRRGLISCANEHGRSLGVVPGMPAWDAATLFDRHAEKWDGSLPTKTENRIDVSPNGTQPRVILLDSVSLVEPSDRDEIVVTGSHGGVLGGRPETACKVDVFGALYNDANVGIDEAGLTRLPALDARGIAAGTVSAWSSRIGDGRSTYEHGFLTHLNETARRYGAVVGMGARDFVELLSQAKLRRTS